MRKLKTLFFFFSFFCAFLCTAVCLSAVQAYAQEADEYGRILSDTVAFFDAAGNEMFLLPKTYFVKITDSDETRYKVEYQSHPGYILKADITPCEAPSAQYPLYPDVKITASFTTFLKTAAAADSADTPAGIITAGSELYYFGSKKNSDNSVWYYVRYGNYLGYVAAASASVPAIVPHPMPLPRPPDTETPPGSTGSTADDISKWILIAGISVPALIIVILLFRPSKKNQPQARIPSFLEEFDEIDDL